MIASVNFASEDELILVVKSGGHDYAGNSVCNDGLVIDLSSMYTGRVDPTAKTARVGAGATWGELYHETQTF